MIKERKKRYKKGKAAKKRQHGTVRLNGQKTVRMVSKIPLTRKDMKEQRTWEEWRSMKRITPSDMIRVERYFQDGRLVGWQTKANKYEMNSTGADVAENVNARRLNDALKHYRVMMLVTPDARITYDDKHFEMPQQAQALPKPTVQDGMLAGTGQAGHFAEEATMPVTLDVARGHGGKWQITVYGGNFGFIYKSDEFPTKKIEELKHEFPRAHVILQKAPPEIPGQEEKERLHA